MKGERKRFHADKKISTRRVSFLRISNMLDLGSEYSIDFSISYLRRI